MPPASSSSLCIIVPTLNSYHLLPRLVESLLSQTCPCWRVLFVDGNSCSQHKDWLINICQTDKRFSWTLQPPDQPGIYGAMNHGLDNTFQGEWVMFWGSDDFAFDIHVISRITEDIKVSPDPKPDLLLYSGCYFNSSSNVIQRRSTYISSLFLSVSFRLSLFLGIVPIHQATVFGPGALSKLSYYSLKYKLASDLFYFLQISNLPKLTLASYPHTIVSMSPTGVSAQQTRLRLSEVFKSYYSAFGIFFLIPLTLRYVIRLTVKALYQSPLRSLFFPS